MRRTLVLGVLLVLALSTGACRKPADPASPAEMKEKMAGKVDWVLGRVDPTAEQEKKVDGLLDRLAPDLFALQEENNLLKRKIITVLQADEVDPAALEEVRKEGLGLFDRYSQRMTKAAEEAAGILTTEQRRELVGLWKKYEFGDD